VIPLEILKMATNYPVNPRVRAFGKARLDIAGRAKNQAQWEKLWKHPAFPFPFVWGESWKQCVEYRVDDFPAEVGFYTDILGLPINALDPSYAMFTSPQGDFFFSVVPTHHSESSTPPDAFRLQFMVQDILATTQQLLSRGIDFEQTPQPLHPGSSLSIASFRTPHGINVELWGMVETAITSQVEMSLSTVEENGDEEDDEKGNLDTGLDENGDDENKFDDDEEDDELIPVPDGNVDTEAGELESVEEGSEDTDEDELGGDQDDDDDFDFDEDDDDFDEDEDDDDYDGDVSPLNSDPRKGFAPNSTTQSEEAKPKSSNQVIGNHKAQAPEYIDLDIT
jgi:catechol 2,3-dioxygenase-like lactoylglutathione lyase family enzyme